MTGTEEDLLQRLRNLDEDVSLSCSSDIRLKVIIVGGGALVLHGAISRATSDIDVLLRADRRLIELVVGLMEAYDINCRVSAYESYFPYNYEDRLDHILEGKCVDYYTASLEDIAIAKLGACRPEDLDDLREISECIDWETLEHLAKDSGELRSSTLNDNTYHNFLANYEEYERRYRPCKS